MLEFRALDNLEFLCGRQFVRQHAAEIAARAAIPPCGCGFISKVSNTNRRLAAGERAARGKHGRPNARRTGARRGRSARG